MELLNCKNKLINTRDGREVQCRHQGKFIFNKVKCGPVPYLEYNQHTSLYLQNTLYN